MPEVTLTQTYNIPDTKDIKCPAIKVEIKANFDDSDSFDMVKYDYFKKNAQKHLDKELETRGKQFIDPIQDAQKKVDSMRAIIKNLEQMQSGSVTKWAKLPELHKQLEAEKKHLEKFMDTANKLIKQAVKSIESFEAGRWMETVDLKAHETAVKKIKQKLTWKKIKLGLKVVLIGAVILTTAAVGIAASVISLNPGPLALAAVIIGAVVSGSSALIGFGKLIKKNWTSESKLIKKIGEDLAALGKVTADIKNKRTPQLKKHLVELAAYRADPAKSMRDLTAQIKDMEKASLDLEKKFKEAAKNKLVGAQDRLNTLIKFKNVIADLKSKKIILEQQDKKAEEVIKASKEILDDFDQLGLKGIEGLPSTWEKLRGNLGGGTENTANLLSQAVSLAAALK